VSVVEPRFLFLPHRRETRNEMETRMETAVSQSALNLKSWKRGGNGIRGFRGNEEGGLVSLVSILGWGLGGSGEGAVALLLAFLAGLLSGRGCGWVRWTWREFGRRARQ
jgi:hypothetical protein